MQYLRERERMFPSNANKAKAEEGTKDNKTEVVAKVQEVYVLDGGFVMWQEK